MTERLKENPKLRVLVVEDSEDDTMIMLRELRREGYEVEHQRVELAASMREALAQDSWDIIICDHALPGFDPIAALKIAQESERDLPFIVVSGKIGEEMAVEGMRAGAADYIMKDRLKRLGPAIARELQSAEERQRKREADEERVNLEEQLRQAQKMEAVGQLAGGIAHDFNNLLTVIVSYSTVLLKEISSDNPWHSDVSEIKNSGERAAVLTRQLLAFSRKQILKPKVIDLGQIVAGMESVVSRLISENIELQFRIDPQLHKIKADASQLEQIIINLAVNAQDAIPEAGKIVIRVRNVALDDHAGAKLGDLPGGDYLMLSVSDNGTGMDEETQSHIFEPFYTTKKVGKGTGLGLSSVFGIAKQSGGGVEVKSQPGRGSDFHIYFPSVDDLELDGTGAQPDSHTGSLEGSETVLLVEDEKVILNLLTRSLEGLGYTLLVAHQGKEALLIAEQHEGRIDMLVTDIVMPQMGGYELAERLVPLHPGMSVLFTTGYDEEMMSDQAMADPQRQFIQKPFVAQDIARRIREVLDNPRSLEN